MMVKVQYNYDFTRYSMEYETFDMRYVEGETPDQTKDRAKKIMLRKFGKSARFQGFNY
tara:strand:- start:1332 stop:1505 length:174 start_codon:yes stop_codon:yes gene_type:complete